MISVPILLLALMMPAPPKSAPAEAWSATGTLLEACSCAVPCPCNFGENPTHDFCHTVYAYRLTKASYGGVTLDGLVFGGGQADKAAMGYLDSRATPAQRIALQSLAKAVFAKGGAGDGNRTYLTVKILADSDPKHFSVRFGENGGFAADVIIGADGKTPIVVENNVTWPVKRFAKGKTTLFRYHDANGNRIEYEGVNANLGEFVLGSSQSTASNKKTSEGCCSAKKKS